MESHKAATIESLEELLSRNLNVPEYQRPYKWTRNNMADLLDDMETAMHRQSEFPPQRGVSFKYRFGTIILHDADGTFNIVDGQQRVISLLLIRRYLCEKLGRECSFIDLKDGIANKITQSNLHDNYAFVQDWFAPHASDRSRLQKCIDSFETLFEVVTIVVKRESEAFQLFDSQNSRGKELDPHDLLKAYHLREMGGDTTAMQEAVNTWETVEPAEIKRLFGKYLFSICNWSNEESTRSFTTSEIAAFKGVPEASTYPFAFRTKKAMPEFQITEPFVSGSDFFAMVDHYLTLSSCLLDEVRAMDRFSEILDMVEGKDNVGFKHARILFETALLAYYDKFGTFDDRAVTKLFSWAFMLRVDLENLGFDSVNRYSIADEALDTWNNRYTNNIPVFSIIKRARTASEISNLPVRIERGEQARQTKWPELYAALKKLNGLEVE